MLKNEIKIEAKPKHFSNSEQIIGFLIFSTSLNPPENITNKYEKEMFVFNPLSRFRTKNVIFFTSSVILFEVKKGEIKNRHMDVSCLRKNTVNVSDTTWYKPLEYTYHVMVNFGNSA